ncbi:hypothetical protein AB0M54_36515 [Actinoplanes sp. NPDC051470]|uniref:hypothetical protein n=1 Tax=unclassified Actinoplanes TaxID=2626549 RepID=UPI00341B27CC
MRTVTRRLALWRADLSDGVCAVPEELRDRSEMTVVLEHRWRGVSPIRASFPAELREDVEWQLTGLEWPDDMRPGVLVTVTWPVGKDQVAVRTTPLDEPVRVDGLDYFHEYDAKVVTREFDSGTSNRGKVLHAVRRSGRVFEDGSAALPVSAVAKEAGLGRGRRGTFLLDNALEQLTREGYLTRVTGSVDSSGYPSYPAVAGQKTAEMLFYAPMVEPVPAEGDDRAEHWVNGFVRKLPPGAHASEKQATLHGEPLEPGYTYVKRHHRS